LHSVSGWPKITAESIIGLKKNELSFKVAANIKRCSNHPQIFFVAITSRFLKRGSALNLRLQEYLEPLALPIISLQVCGNRETRFYSVGAKMQFPADL
jgi:hypothetical protein